MEKLYSSKTCLKWLEGVTPPPVSASARADNNVSYHYCNQPIWLPYDAGQILSQAHNCFEITPRTALALFEHFTLKTRVRFQKAGVRPPPPPGCATGMNQGLCYAKFLKVIIGRLREQTYCLF